MSVLLPPWSIPDHWEWAFLGDRTEVVGGGTPSTKDQANFENGNIPWITPADLSGYSKKYISHGQRNITDKGLAGSGARVLPAGTVIFSSRAPIGYVAIASNPMATNQGFKSFVPSSDLVSDYLYYYLKRAKELAVGLSSGTTFPEISGKKARQIPVPIPPLDVQREIVTEIETQFARLDDAVASLKRARVRLKRYRASVLEAACEGRLVPTEAELARQEGREYEPASVLLERIRAEREAEPARSRGKANRGGPTHRRPGSGQGQLSLMVDGGTAPTEGVGAELSELPEGWAWTTLLDISGKIGDVDHRMPKAQDVGIPYISTKDFYGENGINFENAKLISQDDYDLLSRKIAPSNGDILLSRYGTVGEVRVVEASMPFQASYSVAIIKMTAALHTVKYVATALRSPACQDQIRSHIRASSQPDVGLASIRKLWISLPPLFEQERIVAETDRVSSVIDQMEATVEANLKRSESLRQSILRRAFSGRLVTHDPAT